MHDAGCLVGIGLLFGLIIAGCIWLVAQPGVPAEVAWVAGFVLGAGLCAVVQRQGES